MLYYNYKTITFELKLVHRYRNFISFQKIVLRKNPKKNKSIVYSNITIK